MRGMNISIFSSEGVGATALSAFDDALLAAGVANFNLIRLSSVIPPSTEILTGEAAAAPTGEWGDRLYCVYAEQTEIRPGREAWAGIGWVQGADGRGLFVEHSGASKDEVATAITLSLGSMTRGRSQGFGDVQMAIAGTTCEDKPVCALAIATYEVQGWSR